MLKYKIKRLIEKFYIWCAWHLPKPLTYLATIRLGEYSNSLNTVIATLGSSVKTLYIDIPITLTATIASVPSTLSILWGRNGKITTGVYNITSLKGPYSNKVVPDLTFPEVLKRWEV